MILSVVDLLGIYILSIIYTRKTVTQLQIPFHAFFVICEDRKRRPKRLCEVRSGWALRHFDIFVEAWDERIENRFVRGFSGLEKKGHLFIYLSIFERRRRDCALCVADFG